MHRGSLPVSLHHTSRPNMPARYRDDDFDADEADDIDGEDSAADSDDDPTVPCPFCRRAMWEDAEQCPHCGKYVGGEDSPAPRRPWWVIVTVILLLYVFLRTLLPW